MNKKNMSCVNGEKLRNRSVADYFNDIVNA